MNMQSSVSVVERRAYVSRMARSACLAVPVLAFLAACGGNEAATSELDALGADASVDEATEGPDPDDGDADDDVPPPPPEEDAGAPPPAENDCPRVKVSTSGAINLNVRASASTSAEIVTSLPSGSIVDVLGRVTGESVSGQTEWFKVKTSPKEGYVSAAFATCTKEQAPQLKAMPYHLPLLCGKSARISQGNDGGYSHSGRARYAYDFAIPVGTALTAMADGIVQYTYDKTGPGDRCYNGGGSDCFPYANYVVLRHGDGTGSIYKHLSKVSVKVGDFVPSGKTVGLSGSTGYSTGPHAHVMRQNICGNATGCQSLKTPFEDVPGNGIPVTGQTVKSDNGCPP